MKLIEKYFLELTEQQRSQLEALDGLYHEWNEMINVISRRDIDNLYLHHVLHSMAIGKMLHFKAGTNILDVGTGGGFPGIPLAILFPDSQFTLIDGTGKKIRVAQEICHAIGLQNCIPVHRRCEDEKGSYDFVVSRAVMPLPDLVHLVTKNISKEQHNPLPNGIICLKGGDLQKETSPYRSKCILKPLSEWFLEEWFIDKYCIYLPVK